MTWSSTLSFTVTRPAVANMRFDVELELDHMVLSNVKDLDGTEDFIGGIKFSSLKALSRENNTVTGLWPPPHVAPYSLKVGLYPIDRRITVIKDLSFDQLKNIELTVGGYLADEEGLAAPLSLEFKCSECSGDFPNNLFRNLKFITFPSTQSSIENLLNNGTFQPSKFRGDNFFELNYYEEEIKEHGWAKFMWKVWVKPHL
jgi:hypothetical protein